MITKYQAAMLCFGCSPRSSGKIRKLKSIKSAVIFSRHDDSMAKPAKPTKQKKMKLNLAKKGKTKGIHPNSRKAMKVMGAALRQDRLNARKNTKLQKQHTLGTKLEWFRDHLRDTNSMNNQQILELIENYFTRFDSEVEQISIIQGIKGRRLKQHAARHDVISHQIETEKRDFDTCGFELPDLSSENCVKYLREWNSDLNLLPNIKLRVYNRKELCKNV